MRLLLLLFSAYLTYSTFQYARQVWRETSKFSAVPIFFISVLFLPLAVYVSYFLS